MISLMRPPVSLESQMPWNEMYPLQSAVPVSDAHSDEDKMTFTCAQCVSCADMMK